MKKVLLLLVFLIIASCGRDDEPIVNTPAAQDFTNPEFVNSKLQGKWMLNWINSSNSTTEYDNGDYREFKPENYMYVRTLNGNTISIVTWDYTITGTNNMSEYPVINSKRANPYDSQAFQIVSLTELNLVLKSGTYSYHYTKN